MAVVNVNQLGDYWQQRPDIPATLPLSESDFAGMQALGMDEVRLIVHWSRLEPARGQFDTIVIDTPPMVNISDARVLARYSDAVILVLRSNVTTRDAALGAKRRFAEDGIQVFGTILNGWNPNTPGYGYYRNYYAGYYHYYGREEETEAEVKQS